MWVVKKKKEELDYIFIISENIAMGTYIFVRHPVCIHQNRAFSKKYRLLYINYNENIFEGWRNKLKIFLQPNLLHFDGLTYE